jgi:signal transduction histidine kinase
MSVRAVLEPIILITAVVADSAVLYFVDDPTWRLALGLLVLAVIVWSAARIGVADLLTRSPVDRVYKRRFVHLRSQVQQLLDEIRRMNWMAVDAERGFRDRDQALREMDSIAQRLKGLIEEIRTTAGQVSSEDESFEGEGDVSAG